jgi:hypothetical protein
MKLTNFSGLVLMICFLSSCSDDNAKPVYGDKSGLPVNCRAYVQLVIDDYRAHKYSADDAMTGLERNCGINGQIWKDSR